MSRKPLLVSTSELAEHLGIGPRCVFRLVKFGMPIASEYPYRYNKDDCVQWALGTGSRSHCKSVIKIVGRMRWSFLNRGPTEAPIADSQDRVEVFTQIAQEAARLAVKEHNEQVREGLAEHVIELEQAVEKALAKSGVLEKIVKHAVHMNDLAWMERFKTMSENPSV